MTLWSTIFPGELLISRAVYPYQVASYAITAPAGATIIRASMVGGGAKLAGAAFARVKAACTPGEAFTLQIGVGASTSNGTGNGGDTILTRNTGSVIIARADGAEPNVAGSVAGSIGDVKRAGTVSALAYEGGASAGDDADTYPLGYGGLGAYVFALPGNDWRYPYPGAGGVFQRAVGTNSNGSTHLVHVPAGHGRATVEFFRADPGY